MKEMTIVVDECTSLEDVLKQFNECKKRIAVQQEENVKYLIADLAKKHSDDVCAVWSKGKYVTGVDVHLRGTIKEANFFSYGEALALSVFVDGKVVLL